MPTRAVTITPPTLTRTPVPEPQLYQVQTGDSLSRIARQFGISQETILLANDLADPDSISVGQSLTLLPVTGLLHEVKAGESLNLIAALYGVSPDAVAEQNGLATSDVLSVGQHLLVPGGRLPTRQPTATPPPTSTARPVPPSPTRVPPTSTASPRPATPTKAPAIAATAPPAVSPPRAAPPPPPAGGGKLAWPVAGSISQHFGENGHQGLDIAASMGAPVRAAAEGKVVNLQQRKGDYGWFLVIDHGNGLKTLYAHLSGFNVKLGDSVARGQQIGSVGSTGLSTGPHLHFEVSQNGKLVNPLGLL